MTRTKSLAVAAVIVLTLALLATAGALVRHTTDRAGAPPSTVATDPTDAASPRPTATGGTTPSTAPRGSVTEADEAAPGAADADAAGGDAAVAGGVAEPLPPTHDVVPGEHHVPPPHGPGGIIGELGDDRPVPPGLDLVAPQPKGGKTTGLGGPTGLAVEESCATQCITSGVAHPRGFGALLDVTTSVPAELFLSAVADLDHDGSYETSYHELSQTRVTSYSWALDHLEPGTTYHAMVAATDEHQHTSYAWGSFTTLSKRDVFVSFGDLQIAGGPGNIDATTWWLGFDGPLYDVSPGNQGILLFQDTDREVTLDYWVTREWDAKVCEVWFPHPDQPHGGSYDTCTAWNSTSVDVDVDRVPTGATHWTDTTVELTLHSAIGDGGALPPGYGDPFWFSFEVPVTLYVSYS